MVVKKPRFSPLKLYFFPTIKQNYLFFHSTVSFARLLKDELGIISWGFIDAAHHGQGLGTILLKHRIQQLKVQPAIQKIIVRTSQLVYPFYQKAGFHIIKTTTDYWEEGFDLYEMHLE